MGKSEAAQIPREEDPVRKHQSGHRGHRGSPTADCGRRAGTGLGDRRVSGGKTSAISEAQRTLEDSFDKMSSPKHVLATARAGARVGRTVSPSLGVWPGFPGDEPADPVRDYRDPMEVSQAG